jgi:hypothetical protein
MYKSIQLKLFDKIMNKQNTNKLMHIFCYNENEPEKMEASMIVFKSVFPEKFITVTDNRQLNFMYKHMKDRSKFVHYTTREISYYMMAIVKLSSALMEVITKRPCWRDMVNICIQTSLIDVPFGVSAMDLDINKPEQLIRILSAHFIKNVEGIKKLFIQDSKTFTKFCDDTINTSCKLVEKYIGPMVIKAFEEGLSTAILQNRPKEYIKSLEKEIRSLKISVKTLANQSVLDIVEIFSTNIRILIVYIYTIFVSNIMKIHGEKENFLVTISSYDYSIFIGLLYDEYKTKKDRIKLNIFGDTYQKEFEEQLEFVARSNLSLQLAESEKVRINLLEEEESEKKKKFEKEEKKKLRRNQEENLRKEKEQKQKFEQEEKLRREQEEQLRREQEEKLRREQEEKLRREQEEQLRREQEEKLRREQEEQLRREQEEKLRREQEENLRLEEEKLRREQEEKLRREKEENLRLEEEKLRREQEEKLRREEEEKLRREQEEKLRREQEEKSSKIFKKLNPYVEEFKPSSLVVKIETNGIHIEKEKADILFQELDCFKNNPQLYIMNKNCYLFDMMQKYPQVFKINEIRGFEIAKNIELILNAITNIQNYNNIHIRDHLYTQLKLTEAMFFKIINETVA